MASNTDVVKKTIFCVEIREFSSPWQQGSVLATFHWRRLIGRHQKPYHKTKNYDVSYIQPELWQFKDFPIEINNVNFSEFFLKFS